MFDKISSLVSIQILSHLGPRHSNQISDILRLSQIYHEKGPNISNVWRDPSLRSAYLNYYLHINLLRLVSVLHESHKRKFLEGIDHVIDFGSGPGTFSLAAKELGLNFSSWLFIEKENLAIAEHKRIFELLGFNANNMKWQNGPPPQIRSHTLAVFSYSLNEMQTLPDWAYQCDALLIVEPSTQNEGRALQTLRAMLIENGFYLWAPCTHQSPCPLLTSSKTDWCHHRIHTDLPSQLAELEEHLPIKNRTLTYSYLLARRSPPPSAVDPFAGKVGRIIGDTQYERGKVKQAICRGEKREFLTWLTRNGEPDLIPRGSIIELPNTIVVKGNELRMS